VFSPWLLWKWAVFFYETSLTFEVIITLFFWAVLFDPDDPENDIWDYLDHSIPIVMLIIDYCMNKIPFNLRHLAPSMVIMVSYGIVNISYTLGTGTPVYPPLNFKDVLSFMWLVVLILLECGAYAGITWVTKWKIKKVKER
jgi:hypothetical protein